MSTAMFSRRMILGQSGSCRVMAQRWSHSGAPTKRGPMPSTNPTMFNQRIVLSDGSTYNMRASSPRAQVVLSKDTRNHPAWNPSQANVSLQDESGRLARFARKFGDMGDFDDVSAVGSDAEIAPSLKHVK